MISISLFPLWLRQGEQKRAQDTTLWGSCVSDDGGGWRHAHSDRLWSVAEETVDPVDEEWRDAEVVKFPDHLGPVFQNL